ncbi:hypothetical protein K7472_13405 [Streptomyces sp. PTM05]|uniref:Uncharacterized protein n=1 Tax=Streptantibioticus parmotrematis TaxID=2873249 RepID=A0ABS7QT28_9ACTN|nr:hypothetical protein [Streptantibioticus parmotrematis]MBY8885844.1 hypothetical protein [Streptantibioticus parmotrematis]
MTEFIANVSDEVGELLRETADEMTAMFGISRAEAVARINAQWEGQEFLERSDIVLHEDSYYWSLFIYYDGDVPDWSPEADRSSWSVKSAPLRDSEFWTIAEA